MFYHTYICSFALWISLYCACVPKARVLKLKSGYCNLGIRIIMFHVKKTKNKSISKLGDWDANKTNNYCSPF